MPEMAPVFTDITNQAPDSPTRKSFLDTSHKATKHRPPSLRLAESPAGSAPQSPSSNGLSAFNPSTLTSSSIDIFEDSPRSMHSQGMQSPSNMMCSSPCTPANLIAPAMNQNGIYMPPGAPVRPRKWSNSQSSTPSSQSPSPFGWAGFSPSATNPSVACALFSSPAGTPVGGQAGMSRPAFPMPLTPQQSSLSRQMSFGSLGSSNSQSGGSGSQPMVITPHSQQGHPGFAAAMNEAPPPAPQKVLPPSAHSPITPIPMGTSSSPWM